ncbi:uncharacterized protein LOC129752918 [Uranotaenia lowii]|uniref:uncharacterized protein LOC129752918 n=1 Tax=Uranotaenia lowii TaxID=190385 RepID=UPI002478A2F1|nr:uncharacterized protein LOC129752918 [Uranotaenia lowii]
MAANNRTINMPDENQTSSLVHCGECSKLEESAKLVACDNCSRWFHFSCAGVDDSVKDRSWLCRHCIAANPTRAESNSGQSKASAKSRVSAISAGLDLRLKQLEEERESQARLLAEKQEKEKQALIEKGNLDMEFISRKYALLASEALANEERASVRSRKSGASSRSRVREWLEQNQHLGGMAVTSTTDTTTVATGIMTTAVFSNLPLIGPTTAVRTTVVDPKAIHDVNEPVRVSDQLVSKPLIHHPFSKPETRYTGAIYKNPIVAKERGNVLTSTPIRSSAPQVSFPTLRQPATQVSCVFTNPLNPRQPGAGDQQSYPARISCGIEPQVVSSASYYSAVPHTLAAVNVTQYPVGVPQMPAIVRSEPQQAFDFNYLPAPSQQRNPVSNSLLSAYDISYPIPQLLPQSSGTATMEGKGIPGVSVDEQISEVTCMPPVSSRVCTMPQEIPHYVPLYGGAPIAASREAPTVFPPSSYLDRQAPMIRVDSQSHNYNRFAPQPNISESVYHHQGIGNTGPQPYQLAARQIAGRELPMFSGNAEEWPLFASIFQTSTLMCGFSDAENLLRLQKCLKGSALEAVRCHLMSPSSVPQIMETLEILFGNPERFIQSLLQKVRNVPPPKPERLDMLINFGIAVQSLVGQIKAAKLYGHLNHPSLLQELVGKLPSYLQMDWAHHKRRLRDVNLSTFGAFMLDIISDASEVTVSSDVGLVNQGKMSRKDKDNAHFNAHVQVPLKIVDENSKQPQNPIISCFVCKSTGHRIRDCFKFKNLSLSERWKQVDLHQLCRKCLVPHGRWPCKAKSRKTCNSKGCDGEHHHLLHPGQPKGEKKTNADETPALLGFHRQLQASVLFRIVPVVLYGNGLKLQIFAFFDEGSSTTLIEKEVIQKLGLKGSDAPLCLLWTGNVTREETDSSKLDLTISGTRSDRKFKLRNVRTVGTLGLHAQSLDYEALADQYNHLAKLPIDSYQNAIPKLLIGLDNIQLTLPTKTREGKRDEPLAAKSCLGWSIFGKTGTMENSFASTSLHIRECSKDNALHELVKEFFALESLGISSGPVLQSTDDQRVLAVLQRTTVKRNDGHFECGLLWRFDDIEVPPTKNMAINRLRCLERRLSKHPELRTALENLIDEYQEKQYAHKATADELSSMDPKRMWFLPLGVVLNPRKSGKVRIIWDAAARVNGVAFNDLLLKGPDMLAPLHSVLYRFRQRQICITGDIREMYHQIKIRAEDRQSQLFLWRKDPQNEPDVFVLDVASFGATCSPCMAQYVKNVNAEEWKVEYPEAEEPIKRSTYVDDYADSRDSVEEMVKIALDVRTVHSKAGFELRNFLSNSKEVLEQMGQASDVRQKEFAIVPAEQYERVLGMTWYPSEDSFGFSVNVPTDLQKVISGSIYPTKRSILRVVMSLFDPLGLISNYVIHGKTLLQDIWRAKIAWDEPIPNELESKWKRWIELLKEIPSLRFARCYFPNYQPTSLQTLQVHVFVDASETAFACAIYFRMVDHHKPRVALVTAKAKVTPLKPLSIPRAELEAALIGSRLLRTVIEGHTIPIGLRFMWTDSKTVLSWIKSDARKYRQYVAIRVGEILEITNQQEWHWVPSKLNIADEATKWGKGPLVSPKSCWVTGPEFLYLPENEWPEQLPVATDTEEEMRTLNVHREVIVVPLIDPKRFSKFERLLRSTAYMYYFINRARYRLRTTGLLEQEDIRNGENVIWRQAQAEAYVEELILLGRIGKKESAGSRQSGEITSASQLFKLSPFIDEWGVIRMRSRIEASPFASYDARFPIILPRKSRITMLLIDWYHRKFVHGNNESVVNEIRQRFHISRLRTEVRHFAKECTWCKVYRTKPIAPQMAPLPEARVTPFVRPFTYTGIDYFGPLYIKIGRSKVKRWVALFTCLTIRAIHLEVVASLSTESLKLAMRRFISRRGPPTEIYTDNGTNFVGASRELLKEIQSVNAGLAETFTDRNTKWIFIPPSAPHMGGAWERMVRSVKAALSTLYQCRSPSEEVLQTVLCDAERMVNSRPLTYMPLETADSEALTPNHFIHLASDGSKQPPKNPTDEKSALRSGWNLCQHLLDQMWRRWIREYLPTLTRRTKWFKDVKAIQEGDVVFIADENVRSSWIRGRVVRTLVAKDGRIRQAFVKTSDGILRRPVTKLAIIDVLLHSKPGQPETHPDQFYEAGNVAVGDGAVTPQCTESDGTCCQRMPE